jgi:hypothetical protein
MYRLFHAPFVIARRLPQLWFEALHPNLMMRDETRRATMEKLAAIGEGIVGVQVEAMKAAMEVTAAMMTGRAPMAKAARMPRRIANAAFAPAGRRVRANARRLK